MEHPWGGAAPLTGRVARLSWLAGATAGLWLLAVPAAEAGTSIAPFTLKAKSRIFTFVYPTDGGATFWCAACYAPSAVFSTAGTTGGGLYFYGPRFTAPRTPGNHPTPTSGYYFNPYWGAQQPPGITSSGGAHPGTELSPAAATLTTAGNPQAGPNFVVAPSQPGLVGVYGTLNAVGWIRGGPLNQLTTSFLATNAEFNLASGAGPGDHTYTAVAKVGSRGKVRFRKGSDHANGFGGTLKWLGGTNGALFLHDTAHGPSVEVYRRLPFNSPINAALSGGGQNTWSTVVSYTYFLLYDGSTPTYTHRSPLAITHFTTHPVTTGTVIVSQPYASGFTLRSVHGSDNRTARGGGNITLVTGWLGHRVFSTSTSDFAGTTVYKLHFPPVAGVPSLASPALAALAALVAIAAVYVVRKRRVGA